MNQRRTVPHQLRIVFQSLYHVDPNARRRPVPRPEGVEDTIPELPPLQAPRY